MSEPNLQLDDRAVTKAVRRVLVAIDQTLAAAERLRRANEALKYAGRRLRPRQSREACPDAQEGSNAS